MDAETWRGLQVCEEQPRDGYEQLSCVDADTTSPTVAISSDASAPVIGPFSITVAFSEPVTGFELEDLTITPAASGTVTVNISAGAARDGGRQPERGGGASSRSSRTLTPVPALPVTGALALLLLGGGARRRTAS